MWDHQLEIVDRILQFICSNLEHIILYQAQHLVKVISQLISCIINSLTDIRLQVRLGAWAMENEGVIKRKVWRYKEFFEFASLIFEWWKFPLMTFVNLLNLNSKWSRFWWTLVQNFHGFSLLSISNEFLQLTWI